MNSKEKAEELTLRYYKLGEHLYMPISFAKQCALIVVDEMSKNCYEVMKPFWKEVKQEIEKL